MSETAKRDTAELRYLLGELSEDEKTRMEEAFFADDSKFEALELAEDELIDAYVRSKLSPEDQRKFKAKLQRSPRLVERVNFARALAEKVDSLRSPEAENSIEPALSVSSVGVESTRRGWAGFFAQQPAWGMPWAACAVLILSAGIILVFGWLRLRSESARLAAERTELEQKKKELDKLSGEQQTRTDQLTAELQRERGQRAEYLKLIEELQRENKTKESRQPFSTTIATVLLTSGSLRSGGAQPVLIIGPETTKARTQLVLEKNEYPTYNVDMKRADGTVFFRRKGLKPNNTESGPQLLLSVPSQNLTAGDYLVHVDGVTASGQVESVSDYALRVLSVKK